MGLREAAGLEGAEPQVVHGSPLARVVVQLRGQRFLHAVLHQQLDHYAPRHLEVGASLRRVDRRAQPRTELLDFVVVVVIIVVVIVRRRRRGTALVCRSHHRRDGLAHRFPVLVVRRARA